LSVGEYARIQQFPSTWVFEGTVRVKYTQVGNAVPVGLGHAIGVSIKNALKSRRRDTSLLNQILCWNLPLLARACRRPRTIVNPPRMRKDTKQDSLVDWLKKGNRKRRDFFRYAPKELRLELKKLVSALGRRAPLNETTEASAWPKKSTLSRTPKDRKSSKQGRHESPAA
jgi:DNA (cytosine-5)-methyltransferase 1